MRIFYVLQEPKKSCKKFHSLFCIFWWKSIALNTPTLQYCNCRTNVDIWQTNCHFCKNFNFLSVLRCMRIASGEPICQDSQNLNFRPFPLDKLQKWKEFKLLPYVGAQQITVNIKASNMLWSGPPGGFPSKGQQTQIFGWRQFSVWFIFHKISNFPNSYFFGSRLLNLTTLPIESAVQTTH